MFPFRSSCTQRRRDTQRPVDLHHLQLDKQAGRGGYRVRGPRERLPEGRAHRGGGGRPGRAVGVRALHGSGEEDGGVGGKELRQEERARHGGMAHQNQVTLLIQYYYLPFKVVRFRSKISSGCSVSFDMFPSFG